ncbi:LPS export ABC transporter periplasmic protein LptC [Candidatus Desantisbacteria bacterium CG2_30_40_21]|uniref:LPS export ABC transporter periplasmic protein LptC n=5 Tax=unclassified Candidatus Desantisiibacteriota TaxID=3106372 RepID=A0A2M7JB91_9BACT|nr:MAG: LPS export ABC transporter periplasmic protein LptC [Candidatus Desantisbacteria bacterium CG2_30_40_21]PIP40958.1 MAG: LPS export ABC transporter periplasmic protein LptC [Candidatus Desantisbacteria bacterium CG23_combo_of_CG06-09_8_20_14_all_40_23]PIX16685.1 MAG: LPS export ABC transporter periplasmic protein LptC [Candidatus Desantisbacteria bacterium CG_4_8_14_3_um_filter_40_12]PIY18860.1 MAG: LPS export ABC transporter periplasmic protein LptC [Candidatus Desantisbacteria bacterium
MNIQHLKGGFRLQVYNLSKQGVANPKIGILILCLCVLMTGCSPRDKAVVNILKDESEATLKGFHLVETVNGKPQWELSGKNAETKQDIINIHNINCTFFHSQTGEIMLKVISNSGRLETNTREIELIGKVIAEDSSKNLFYSSRLIWDAGRSVLNSPEEITIQMKNAIFKADTLTIDPDTQVIEAKGVRISIGGQPFNPSFDNEVQR